MNTRRIQLQSFRGLLFTPDTVEAIKRLEEAAWAKGKWKIQLHPPGTASGASLVPAGREVHLTLVHDKEPTPQRALEALWGFAIPQGFTPWSRYPILAHDSLIFHYLGPWQALLDRLMSEGRGHLAWPSVCAAARVDVGAWTGENEEAVFIQAQLHRVGLNPGPVDGVIGTRTTKAMERLGLVRPSMVKAIEHLRNAQVAVSPQAKSGKGFITIPGKRLAIGAFGGVSVVTTPTGASLDIRGPGRVIVDIESGE